MAYISKSSDGVLKPKLATKGDMDILQSHQMAKESIIHMADKYVSVKQQRDAEAGRKYPSVDFIKRCDVILARLLPAYQQVYGNQK